MTRRSRTLSVAALALSLLAGLYAAGAAAQWAWKDDNGRLVYSNLPPPSSVKPGQIVRQPGAGTPVVPPSAVDGGAARPTAPAASNAPKTIVEREAEFRKRQQERTDGERKAEEEQQKVAQKAAECERARGHLRALEDGMRLVRTDAAGNREYLDDAQRAAEVERTRKSIAQFCN
jgi:hypothetical protein